MRYRILIAAQPGAWPVIQPMLADVADLLPVQTMAHAFEVLEREAASIDLIVCTIAFDDSRMIDFLQEAKRRPATAGIPFLCSRILKSVLSDDMIDRTGASAKACGAVEFLDIGHLGQDAAQIVLKDAVLRCAIRRA